LLTPIIDQPNTSKSPIAQTILSTLSSFVPSPNLFKQSDLTFTQSSSQTTHQHPASEHQQSTKIDDDPVFNTPTRATTSATQLTKHPPMADQETNTPE
ncbi:13947_t:CDS:2, partial [Gigaspora margarita]